MSQHEPPELVAALRDSARRLRTHRTMRDLEATISSVVETAVDTIAAATGGGITRAENGALSAGHATSAAVLQVDRLQAELVQGPCVTAAAAPPPDGVVFAHDLAGEDAGRWPAFAPRAVDLGWRSVMSIEMGSDARHHSALNLYSPDPGVFRPADAHVAALFAVQASMLIYGGEHVARVGQAVADRDGIGRAEGILMERFGVDADQAFEMLISASQDTDTALVDVAAWLVAESTQPEAQRGAERDTWGWDGAAP
jgi:hypothetical protein